MTDKRTDGRTEMSRNCYSNITLCIRESMKTCDKNDATQQSSVFEHGKVSSEMLHT